MFIHLYITIATFIIIWCLVLSLRRDNKKKDRDCQFEKLATKQTMDKKNKQTLFDVIPSTDRNACGRNWELYKRIATKMPPLEDTSCKENFEISYGQKIQKKEPYKLNVDVKLQSSEETENKNKRKKKIEIEKNTNKITKCIAMDCEMVGVRDGTQSMIARVSIVNSHNYCIYDKYVKPMEEVTDYRTKVSGIRPHDLKNGEDFHTVQKEVAEILKGRILIGHALEYDLRVLYLFHPRRLLRDTSRFKSFTRLSNGKTPSLKKLAFELLGREIQSGEHSSVEDARATMQLYLLYKNSWEAELCSKRK